MPHRLTRRTATVGWLVLMFPGAFHAASTGLLNDTDQLRCDNGSNVLATCTDANTGDGSTMPRQDGRIGRDAAYITSSVHLGGGASR